MKRNQLVSVRRSEYSELVKDVVSEVITMQYGVYSDTINSPEYIAAQANKREVPPITLELIGVHERILAEPTETKKPLGFVKPVEKEVEAEYTTKHKGSGKYDVINKSGEKMNEVPLTKEEANEMVTSLNN